MNLLLLAGTGESRRIASELAEMDAVRAVASLAGMTRQPRLPDIPCRIGGFGSAEGFADYLKTQNISAVLDATHPYADRISARSWQVCKDQGVPYMQLLRPGWSARDGDNWTHVACEEDAALHIHPPAKVFLASGRQTLPRFSCLAECELICRQIDPPDDPFPFPNGRFLVGRPPFSMEDEIALFRKLAIDWLVVKNAGGNNSRSKLDAARELGIPVLMIERPAGTGAPVVETIDAALDWVRRQL